MIQIQIEIKQGKSSRVSIAARVGVCKKTATTKSEKEIAGKVSELVRELMAKLATTLPDAKLATSEEDVETLKSLEDIDL